MFRLVASTIRLPQGLSVQRNTETQLGNMGMVQITVGNGAHVELSGCVYYVPILQLVFRIKVIL